MANTDQLDLFEPSYPLRWDDGHEHCGYYTLSEVPGGFYCDKCQTLIDRSVCYANEPEILGYESATWAWYYREGKPWTRDYERPIS